jgi:putative transposase
VQGETLQQLAHPRYYRNNMPSITREFANGEIYHIFNRGVEKRNVFMDESDYYRFIFSLYECNDATAVRVGLRMIQRRQRSSARFHLASLQGETLQNLMTSKRELLVEIIAFVLMPNHYHLILRQLVDGGISLFMKKLSNGYTGYFNDRYERKGMGGLFQGAFKAVHVADDRQFLHLAEYVFSNPIELVESDWKAKGVQDPAKAIDFLNNYKWSSYLDAIGTKNFPSVTERDFLWKIFAGSANRQAGIAHVKEFTEAWVKNKSSLSSGLAIAQNLSPDR